MRSSASGVELWLSAMLFIAPVSVRAEAPPPTRAEKWAWQPYDVSISIQVSVDIERQADWLPRYRSSLLTLVSSTFGPLWIARFVAAAAPQLSTSVSTTPTPASLTPASKGPERPDATSASPRPVIADDVIEKRMTLTLDLHGSAVRLTAAEFDAFTGQSSHTIATICADPDRIEWATVDLLARVFRPLSLVEPIRGGGVSVTTRGERLWPECLPAPTATPCEVFYRYLNKSRAVESIQAVPFTYLVHEAGEAGGEAAWTVVSGLRSPLAARRQRVDVVGLAVGPLAESTRLTLQSRRSASKKLAGLDLDVSLRGSDASHRLISDRAGLVTLSTPTGEDASAPVTSPLPATGAIDAASTRLREPRMTQIEVHSGKAVLARIPLIVGAHREMTLELQDDTLRLNVEGDLAILQAAVIDAVSRRAVLMARIRRDARLGLWPVVETGLKELESLPDLRKFRTDLAGLQLPAQSLARADRDRQTEARIKRMCAETDAMMARFLAEEPVQVLRSEINDLQSALRDAEANQKRAELKKQADEKAALKKAEERRAAPIQKTPPAAPKPGTGL
jgi:hypothetical protein